MLCVSALPPAVVPRCVGAAACEAATRSWGKTRRLRADRNANGQVVAAYVLHCISFLIWADGQLIYWSLTLSDLLIGSRPPPPLPAPPHAPS
jgi:hypothetical protein